MPVPIKEMQRFVANISITPSAVRSRRGAKGAMHTVIKFLAVLDISSLADASRFSRWLDDTTDQLLSRLPSDFQFWGTARKCVNIFLRDASYNALLRENFRLDILDPVLETPLDRWVASGLRCDAGRNRVPPWDTIIGLKPEEHAIYQAVAAEVAREKYNTYRANLDLWYFRRVPAQPSP
jgi:hypothetical protein